MSMGWPDVVAILCPGDLKIEDDRVVLEEEERAGYLGSRIRLDAAAIVFAQTKKLVLVGGSESRVRAMHAYLCVGGASGETTMIVSAAETSGNLHALRCLIDSHLLGAPRSLGILTNAYHQHRVMLMASDILDSRETGVKIVPLVAEALAGCGNPRTEALEKRMANEMNGVLQWMQGLYRDQHRAHQEWPCKII